jgi:hypothetical protein
MGGISALEEAALRAFGTIINRNAVALTESIKRAAYFARSDTEDGVTVLVLDRRSLLLSFIEEGVRVTGRHASSTWLVGWLMHVLGYAPETLLDIVKRHDNARPNANLIGGTRLILSHSVRALLPEAKMLAQQTVKRDVIDLRHLMFAFLNAPAGEWEILPEPPSPEQFALLRQQLVGEIARRPEPREDVEAWRTLIGRDEMADPGPTPPGPTPPGPTPPSPTPPSPTPTPTPTPRPPKSPRPPKMQQDDRYRTQADDPARLDALERGPFAQVMAARIIEVRDSARGRAEDDDRAFMVHIHGPWGSGKSSLLNLLQSELEKPTEAELQQTLAGKKTGSALVVWFNAWKHQRMRPPWWALMSTIYHGAMRRFAASPEERVRFGDRFRLWRLWWSWRWKAEVFPILLVAVLGTGLALALLGPSQSNAVETLTKIGAAMLAGLAAVYGYARLMIFGSQKAVQAYADLTTDPYRRIVGLFNRLVDEISAPLVVFIDDLDRCDSDYVVELLEGIQTLFRHAPVTYVVAADRKWICSSFEKKYDSFAGAIGEPCRPLGYLFLDKLFQISAGMPRLTPEIKKLYLEALLADGDPAPTAPDPALIERARERMEGKTDEAEIGKEIAKSQSVQEERANRAAGALQITTAVSTGKTENRLKKLSDLIEPNPRAMKQLVNRVAMEQARGILEGRISSPETRARWAMLQLRWPLFADFIADNPEAITHWRKRKAADRQKALARPDSSWPASAQALLGNATVMNVVGGPGDVGALTPKSLSPLLT